jgi:hypothetical protein
VVGSERRQKERHNHPEHSDKNPETLSRAKETPTAVKADHCSACFVAPHAQDGPPLL